MIWPKDESLEDTAFLKTETRKAEMAKHANDYSSDLDIIAGEVVEDLQAALAQFAEILSDLKK
jgi:hypothetical protein